MRKSTPILLSVTVLLILSLACGLPSIPMTGPTLDINSLGTAIMQTMISAATQTAGAVIPVQMANSPTATQTFTPEPPTLSPTVTLTPTPLTPLISVSMDTNCRVGPGKAYARVGALLIGEVAEVIARDPTGRYWFIKNPDRSNEYCWLWGEYATLTGNLAVLPMYTPPPTPTLAPGFQASYDGLESCSGWWVDIKLKNTGSMSFKSISLTVKDSTTDGVLSLYADRFIDLDGCNDSSAKDYLNPSDSVILSTPLFSYSPSGHELRATITLCSAAGQNGTCVTQAINFTP